MTPREPLLDALVAAVGAPHVLVDADLRAGYETDWTGRFHGPARAVVRPADTAEVAAVLQACAAHGVGVVPQGGNTGLVGGSVPRGSEVVLSLRRLDRIDVDAAHGEAVVGAGATLGAVQAVARAAGWDTGVDLASRDSATIGGMVATNAGGEHVLRYGPTAEQLLGVEAVLASGARIGRVPALRKDNTGYRWAGLLAGSEGTLAVVTAVHLRLVPQLPDRVVALLALDDLAAAVDVCAALRRSLPDLVALEAFVEDGLRLVLDHTGLPAPFATPAGAYVLAECAGPAATGERLLEALSAAVGGLPAVRDAAVAADAAGRARLWRYREGHTEAINAVGIPHKLDVTLPFARLAPFADEVRGAVAAADPSARVVLFGHLGDGNLHVNVLGPAPDDPTVDDVVLGLAAREGGSISAEHGIGVAKRAHLHLARSAADIAAMRAVKQALDPTGVLNPGVLLPEPR